MFNLSMPYNNDHPLFHLEVRRIRWGKSPRHLRRYSLWAIGIVGLIAVVSSFALSWIMGPNDFLILLISISIMVNIVLDIICFSSTLNSIDSYERRGWRELLWMTPSGGQGIILVKYAVAQVRAWLAMMIAVSLRFFVVMFALAHLLADSGLIWPQDLNFIILFVPMIVVFGSTSIMEPVWRMRALTALGLWVSARMGNAALMGLSGIMMIIVVWITQFVVLGFLLWLASVILNRIFFDYMTSMLSYSCGLSTISVITALIIYRYYRILGAVSLNRALRNTFHE